MAKKIITNKQHIILVLLYIFRFLNSKQIQEFMNHKDHRRINSWLKDLAEKEYIVKEFKPIFGTLTKPAVCYLTAKGRMHLKKYYQYHFPKYLRRISRDYKISKGFRIKCQILADWYTAFFPPKEGIPIIDTLLKELTMEESEDKIPINTLQFFTPSYFPSFKLLEGIKPDAYFRKRTSTGTSHGMLFVIDAYTVRFLLRYLVKRVITTVNDEYWEDDSIKKLELYLLCPNNQLIIYLKRMIPRELSGYAASKPLYIHFATRNQLYSYKIGKSQEIKWKTMSSEEEYDY